MLLMLGVDGVLQSDYCTQTALLNPAPSTNFSDCVPHFPVISSQKSQHSNRLLPKLPTTLPSLPTRTQLTLVRCLTHSTLSPQLKFSKLLSTIPPKTCSMDFIPTVLIKSCQTVFADLIATMANLSFEGTFPSVFKTAVVTPRLKKPGSDPDSPENYRPISNLNSISKILERLFLARIQQHITTCANFNQFQSAYRP